MKQHILFLKLLITSIIALSSGQSAADEIRIAVASNFSNAITSIAQDFEIKTGHKVALIFGSTGKHYAQIKKWRALRYFFLLLI